MISIKHLEHLRSGGSGIHDINLEVEQGEQVVLIGPSGSGKSTLLHCINLLNHPQSGEIIINGKNILETGTDMVEVRKKIGMTFQEFTLFSHKTLLENVMMGPHDLLGLSKEDAIDRAEQYLKLVGLWEKKSSYPEELSGGQKQRGEIARCLAMEPDILLLDEPTSALDSVSAGEVQAVIRQLASEGRTMIIVTHDLEMCRNIGSRVVVIKDGRILEEGTPEDIFEQPKYEETWNFVQQLRTLHFEITSRNFDLYELNARIEQFGHNYFLTEKQIRNMELVIEELVFHSIMENTDHIQINVQYFGAIHSAEMEFIYGGKELNPFDNDDEDLLSMLLVRPLTSDVQYEYTEQNYLKFLLQF